MVPSDLPLVKSIVVAGAGFRNGSSILTAEEMSKPRPSELIGREPLLRDCSLKEQRKVKLASRQTVNFTRNQLQSKYFMSYF